MTLPAELLPTCLRSVLAPTAAPLRRAASAFEAHGYPIDFKRFEKSEVEKVASQVLEAEKETHITPRPSVASPDDITAFESLPGFHYTWVKDVDESLLDTMKAEIELVKKLLLTKIKRFDGIVHLLKSGISLEQQLKMPLVPEVSLKQSFCIPWLY